MAGKLYDEKILFFIISFSIILTALGMDWLYQGLEEQLKINRIVKVSGLIEKEKSCLIKKIEIIER